MLLKMMLASVCSWFVSFVEEIVAQPQRVLAAAELFCDDD
jgi:hypothetical protein